MKQTICVLLVLMLLLCGCGGPGEAKEPQTEADHPEAVFFPVTDALVGDTMPFFADGKMNIFFLADQRDGKLVIGIRPAEEGEEPEPQPDPEIPEPEPNRSNNTVLKDDFSGTQGKAGWYYGSCEWNGASFNVLPYDTANQRYMDNGKKPELKADYVEPGNGKNAAYKWIVAEDGRISVKGEYVKFENSADPDANGTCMRIILNGGELCRGSDRGIRRDLHGEGRRRAALPRGRRGRQQRL